MSYSTVQQQIEMSTEILQAARIYIGMPCYGGNLQSTTFMSFIQWSHKAYECSVNWGVECVINESLITRARNICVASFLSSPAKFTHLMFIDADITFEPWHILALLARDEDVVGGLYTAKSMPTRIIANNWIGDEKDNGLREARKIGTGFMMIKRHVFEKLDAHPNVVPVTWETGMPDEVKTGLKTYFDTSVRDGRYLSEDWFFCENWRDLGGKVWLDTNVQLAHTGSFVYGLGAQEELYKSLHGFYKGTSVQILE